MGAISSMFTNCKTYLCDFHREQCWQRWMKDHKHGLSPEEVDILLSLLRDIAQSPPTDSDLPLDHNYHQHFNNLKQSNVWKKNVGRKMAMFTSGKSDACAHVYTQAHY